MLVLLVFSDRLQEANKRVQTMGVLKDFNTSKVSHTKAVDGKNKFSMIQPGVAYRGTCLTRGCEAYQKSTVCNRGMGNHLVNDDIVSDVPRCPSCSATFVVQDILLFQCRATITVHDQTEERTQMIARDDDVVLIGQRTTQQDFFSSQRLVTVEAIGHQKGCTVM